MIRSFFVFWLGLALAAVAREPISLNALKSELSGHLSDSRFAAAAWGVKIVSLDSGSILFETNALKLLKPASNAKLYGSALALDKFGPDYRIRTSIYSESAPSANGVLQGDLIIYGRGDPSFSARFNGGSYTNLFAGIIAAVRRAGIRSIEGDLVGDETYFTGPRPGSGWSWDDLSYSYGAEVSALSLQDNVIDLFVKPGRVGEACTLELKPATDYLRFIDLPRTGATNAVTEVSVYRGLGSRDVHLRGILSATNRTYVDAVTVPNPALWFVTMLKEALVREGIAVRGQPRALGWPVNKPTKVASLRELGFVESRPMREILEKTLKPSQNLYAQLLLLQAGARLDNASSLTEELGVRALRSFLRKAVISSDEVLLEEGSGLSRGCLVTPNATVRLLQFMARHEHAKVYVDSLPEPGEGTLRRRMLELKGNVRAKTGSLRYVNTLSGYMTSGAGERLAFSILLNAYNPPDGAPSGRDAIDFIPRLLAGLGEKTAKN